MVDSTLISSETSVASLNSELTGYRVLRQVGHGAMGVVFEAEQTNLGRRVAIKVLPPNLALRERTVKRFLREAEAMGRLAHANIVDVYEVGSIRATHFFSMKFVEGPPLDRVLRAGPLAIQDVVQIGIDVAAALAHAHSRGVMHRDIKPGNLLRDGERVVLTDFGLARPLNSDDAGSMTESGDLVGTPLYMSPEQISGDSEHVDGRSDVWGLGVTLYELLLQRAPFHGQNAQGILHAILHRDPPLLSKQRDDVPRDLEAVVHRCLEKDPARRYAGAAALYDDLIALREGRQVSARTPRFFDPAVRWMRRNPVEAGVLGASLLVVVVLAVIGWVYVWPRLKTLDLIAGEAATAKAATKTAEAETKLKKLDFVRASARTVMSESSRMWQEGRTQHNEDQCREAEERIFDLMRTRALDDHPELCAEALQLAASWARVRGRPAAMVQSELESWIGAVDPSHVLLNRAAILTGLELLPAALATHRERAIVTPLDPSPRLDGAKLVRRMANDARVAGNEAVFRGNLATAMALLDEAAELAIQSHEREVLISVLIERAHCRLDSRNPVQLERARADLLLALREDDTRVDAQSLLMAVEREAEGLPGAPQALLARSDDAAPNASTDKPAPRERTSADFQSPARGVRGLYDGLRKVLRAATTPTAENAAKPAKTDG